MADSITPAIVVNATSPQSMSGDGVSVTNTSINDQIAAKKFLDANDALANIAAGGSFFGQVRMVPPSARGDSNSGDNY